MLSKSLVACVAVFGAADARSYDSAPPDAHAQAKAMVAKMTMHEKIHMVHGNSSKVYTDCNDYVGCIPSIKRIGIPALRFQDGPQGFRVTNRKYDGTSTQWPSGMTVGMSWDRDLMKTYGEAVGKEFHDKGANVMFGPAVNVHRVPVNGRNFEYLSGEDPFLGQTLVKPLVEGVQSAGVIANVKHYIDNNQEGQNLKGEDGSGDRHSTSSNVDERTQVEIYFPPYQGAVQGGVLSAMCGNNLVNGVHACENNFTQNTLLREWGSSAVRADDNHNFEGFMCSDYRGTQSVLGSALGGLDLQLPGCQKVDASDPTGYTCVNQQQRPNFFGKPLMTAVNDGKVPQEVLDEKVERILYAMIKTGAMARNKTGDASTNVTSSEHNALAYQLAAQSAVLLQNEGSVLPFKAAGIADGIVVIGAAGHDSPITGGGGSGRVAGPYQISVVDGLRTAVGKESAISYYGGSDAQQAAKAATGKGYAVVVLASNSQEGRDRRNLTMPDEDLVSAVAAVQPNTIVVVAAPGAFLAPWASSAPGILHVAYNGQEHGRAIADILMGNVSPSGKLSFTIPNKENEIGLSKAQYPGIAYQGNCTLGFKKCYNADYTEKLEVGYRWYHANGVKPHFPFGHGLSYSTFELSDFIISNTLAASVQLKNTGNVKAAEVVQLYLTYPESAGEPPRQLRGFAKAVRTPGQTEMVTMQLSTHDFSIWDATHHGWKAVKGEYKIEVGTSSEDLQLVKTLQWNGPAKDAVAYV